MVSQSFLASGLRFTSMARTLTARLFSSPGFTLQELVEGEESGAAQTDGQAKAGLEQGLLLNLRIGGVKESGR